MSWLWKSDTSSPASFEKALSKLSGQITSATVALEKTRSRERRAKALWTLYTTLAYLVYTLIVGLVIGPQKWALPHLAGLIGAPVLIFGVRKGLTVAFEWQANRQQRYLDGLQKQREEKITALKKATRYDSTQELLQKYGGTPSNATPSKSPQQGSKPKSKSAASRDEQRTGLPPPPTANIPSRTPQSSAPVQRNAGFPARPDSANNRTPPRSLQSKMQSKMQSKPVSPDAPGFAPNAFSQPPASRTTHDQTPNWYDRILDVLLGEDETLAKNRIALLCQNCRLVNGQAPPGVRTLEELGKWRCSSCGFMNGQESEAAKVVKEITQQPALRTTARDSPTSHSDEDGEDVSVPLTEIGKDQDIDSSGTSTAGLDGTDAGSRVTKRVTRSAGKAVMEGL